MAATYNREQIRAALAQTDPALSFYLDLDTGSVVRIDETDSSPATEQLRDQSWKAMATAIATSPAATPAPTMQLSQHGSKLKDFRIEN